MPVPAAAPPVPVAGTPAPAELPLVLHLGCGRQKPAGHYGVDCNPRSLADARFDLDVVPWPLPSDHFQTVICPAIIEHLRNFYGVFEEIWRVSRPGARVTIDVPHYSDLAAFTDPTHVHFFTTRSFDVLAGGDKWAYYTAARFRPVRLHVTFLSLWRVLGWQWLVNLAIRRRPLRFIRNFWEQYLCFVVRAKSMTIELEVVKDGPPAPG